MAIVNRRRNRKGTVLVEAALVIPILLLTLGLIEYGWMFLTANEITNAARNGARAATLPKATNASVNATVATLMTAAGLQSSGYSVTYLGSSDVHAVAPEQLLTVQISVSYKDVSLLNLPLIPVPDYLNSSVTMTKEGP